MDWTNRDMLKRIVALLFALADLADGASLAPWPVRALALAILHRAEAVAQAFVFSMAYEHGVTMPPHAHSEGDDIDDATRLASSLRLLAQVLANLSAWAGRYATHGSGRITATTEVPRKPGQLADYRGKNTPTPDTS